MWKKVIVLAIFIGLVAIYVQNGGNVPFVTKPKVPSPVLQIATGQLRGIVSVARSGREYYEYLGIPYAKAPVGKLRFESPEPPEKWTGIRNAGEYGAKCIQIDIITQYFQGEEDCLFLNVFVPKRNSKKLMPVMLWIHGGLFMFGGADRYRPKYFMDEDVVLVTIHYRVGALGFLNTGDGVVRGNMGLKDQVMALRWVQQNIRAFGGDSDKVTIFGDSAGAASVHFHMLSPMSKGLFHKAISQSGTALNPWVLSRHPKEAAERFAKQLNCPIDKSDDMVQCLKSIDARVLGEIHRETLDLLHDLKAVFTPTIETVHDAEAFLLDDPLTLLKQGKIISKVPWISGVNADEGLILSTTLISNETMLRCLQNDWNDVSHKILFYERDDKVSKEVRKHYFGKDKMIGTPQKFRTYTNMLSDRSFFYPIHESAKWQAQTSPVYLYYFNHAGEFSLSNFLLYFRGNYPVMIELLIALVSTWFNKNVLGQSANRYGVCHSDEQQLQFNLPFVDELTPKDREHYGMSVDFNKLWVAFANDGELNFRGVQWEPASPESLRYLLIELSYGMVDEPFSKRIEFWQKLSV